jgi:probable HAF family extracellular repeat protein
MSARKMNLLLMGGLLLTAEPYAEAAGPTFTIQDIGPLGGQPNAMGINKVGQVAGSFHLDSTSRAFFWNGTTMRDIGDLGGGQSSGYGINSAGHITGISFNANSTSRAFFWNGTTMVDIGTLPGGANANGTGINDSDHMTGTSGTPDVFDPHAFFWNGTTMQDLGVLQSASFGGGINSTDKTTGRSYVYTPSTFGFENHAFFWNGTTMQDLGTLGRLDSFGTAINDTGSITGYVTGSLTPNAGSAHAFFWNGTTMQDIGTLFGFSYGRAINNLNQIVGSSDGGAFAPTSHAFYWDGVTMWDLNNQVPSLGGWTELTSALAINDAGQVAGYGILNGQVHAFLLTPVPAVPLSTTSYYVTTTNSSTLYNAGRDLAIHQLATGVAQDRIVGLLFRAPTLKNGVYGVSGLGGYTPLSTVEDLVEDFASGYYNNLGANNTLHIRIAISTSNGTTQCGGNQVSFGHGHAWAQMVNRVASWVLSNGYSEQVDIAGGSDMEASSDAWPSVASCAAAGSPEWAGPVDTKSWVNGYNSVSPKRYLYDLGDAGGCPQSGTTAIAGSCAAGWTQEDIWYVSWGTAVSWPVPEVYRTDGVQAAQWQQLSLYGFLAHGENILLSGTLTELGACQQRSCPQSLQNSPLQGWQQLYNDLNNDSRTRQILSWATDLSYLY